MVHLHIRIPKETHDRLVRETMRNPKAKNKSDHARRLLSAALGAGKSDEDATGHLLLERLQRSVDELRVLLARVAERSRFAELALTEFVKKQPGLVEELNRRAREMEAADRIGASTGRASFEAAPKRSHQVTGAATVQATETSVRDPRKMTKDERAAWKRQLAHELTEED